MQLRLAIAFWIVLLLFGALLPRTAQSQSPGALPAEADPAEDDDHLLYFRGQVFGAYEATFTDHDDFNEFLLRRAELGAGYEYDGWAGLFINVEAIRSAGPESLFGIQGNSIVPRFKHGFGYASPELGPGVLTVRLGLIPDPWIDTLEAVYELRALTPTTAERGAFFDTSDLGGSVGYALWNGFLEVRLAYTNGEGRANIEQNTGKNTTAVLSVRPLSVDFLDGTGVLGIHGAYRDGSTGTGSARDHRITGALTWHHPWFSVGAEYVHALGWLGRGTLEANGIGGWAEGHVIEQWLGLALHFDRFDTNLDGDDDHVTIVSAGVYSDFTNTAAAGRLRLHLNYENRTVGSNAGAVPGVPDAVNAHVMVLTAEAHGLLGL